MNKELTNFLDELLLVVVIYRCLPENSATWSCLVTAAERYQHPVDLYLYDNSPIPLEFSTSSPLKIHYQHDPDNPGVSKAYNKACGIARLLQKKWILLLDQDTSFGNGWLEEYFKSTIEQPQYPIKVPVQFSGDLIISPFRYWATKGFHAVAINPGIYSLKKYFAVNSGILIHRQVFELIGGYDELIPLDFSDFALMWKLKRHNYSLHVLNLQGRHELSSFGNQDVISAQSRFRQYCRGSKHLIGYSRQPIRHFAFALGRALLLGIRHRSLNFVFILIESWTTG